MPPLQTSVSAGGPSPTNSFKLASLQKQHGFKNGQRLWKQELLDWWNFSDTYSLTSKPSTLHKTLLYCCQILKPSYLVRPLLLPSHCGALSLLQSTWLMQLLQATEQAETTIAHHALLPLWHLESRFVFICHNLTISSVWELRLVRSVQQRLWHFPKIVYTCMFCIGFSLSFTFDSYWKT